MLREQHRALRRPVGRVVVDRLETGVEQVEHAVGLTSGLETGVVVVSDLGRRRHGPARLPAEQRPVGRVAGEQMTQRGGAGAREADDEDRLLDLLLVRGLGMRVVPVGDAEPVRKVAAALALEHAEPERREPGLRGARRPNSFEAVAERRVAEIVEPGLGCDFFEHAVDGGGRADVSGHGCVSSSRRSRRARLRFAPARRGRRSWARGRTRRHPRRAFVTACRSASAPKHVAIDAAPLPISSPKIFR